MERHVVIGTAGHVDHGKTALVKALTGIDTDRWEEEKRRGITIDLGFAPLDLGNGREASVVDVPGHEDFVRNMVAGATGIDVALLVVAADEGVMPQTVEHTAILDFLAVRAGVVALTKVDLVDHDWLDLVRSDVTDRLAGTGISWEPPVAVSAVTAEGLTELRDALRRAAAQSQPRARDDLFRMPIDRVFSLPGAGTVATGTTWSGTIGSGDEVIVLPGPHRARVRSVEVHGRPVEHAPPGCRTALALVGVDRAAVRRGSIVVQDGFWKATAALDVMVTLLPGVRPLTQRSQVRAHIGTAEILARVVPLAERVAPGAGAQPARLRLQEPMAARWGDRGVLRSSSPMATIGGCVVVDPWPGSRPRRPVGAAECATADPIGRLRAFVSVAGPGGLSINDLPVRLGVHPSDIPSLLAAVGERGVVRVGDNLVAGTKAAAARELVLARLAAFHRDHALHSGMPVEAFRRLVPDPRLADQVLEELVDANLAAKEHGTVRLAEHRAGIPRHLEPAAKRLREALGSAGNEGRSAAELASTLPGVPVVDLAEFFVREGTALRVGRDRYYDRGALEGLVQRVLDHIRETGSGTPGELRDAVGLTRKYLIPVLEWMDEKGLTIRTADSRRLGPVANLGNVRSG